MKQLAKLILLLLIASVATKNSSAQPPWAPAYGKRNKEWREHGDRDDRRRKFYYYPSENVYFCPDTHRYWYPRNGVWVDVDILPPALMITNRRFYPVYYDGYDVWRENREHMRYYHVKPRPRVNVNIDAFF
ncbi:MAG: hypothetical protein KGO81_08060 [Bacteroidota bacterium]|nr:hypothetical protein [Bacteroidota bacterium]